VFTLNRAIQLRDGRKGREDDVLSETYFIEREEPPADIFDIYNPERYLPGKSDEVISYKGKAVDRKQVTKLMDEYYEFRGWDVKTGFLKKEILERLDLTDVIKLLGEKVL
jgi:aldehyde:ferredoxin oxidoreductase